MFYNRERKFQKNVTKSNGSFTTQTLKQPGRPRVSYNSASTASKTRMKARAATVVDEMVQKCHKISQGDGWELLNDILKKTPIGINAERNKEAQKLNNVINDLKTAGPRVDFPQVRFLFF